MMVVETACYKAAETAGIEAPSRDVFKRDTRNPTFRIHKGIIRTVFQGAAWADPAWLDTVLGFERFVVDLGPRLEDDGLDRIDASKPWSFTNARWARKTQYSMLSLPKAVVEIRRMKRDTLAKTHGLAPRELERRPESWLYRTWTALLGRYNNPFVKDYVNYGGRGIKICDEWGDACTWGFESFAAYILSTLGPRPEGHTLDRVDNGRGYEPGNLRWATAVEQAANRRSTKKAA
jgi:hypothetical protein